MLGTGLGTRGGISAVVNVYRRAGLFDRWPIIYLPTHTDRGQCQKIVIALGALIRFVRLLIMGRVALVHVHGASGASFWRKLIFILLAFAAHRPVIYHLHGGGFVDFFRTQCGRVGQACVRLVLSRSARVVLLSPQWETAIRAIAPEAALVIIPNPVEVSEAHHAQAHDQRPHDVVFVGRLERDKGIFDLVDAFSLLIQEFPSARLRCAGDGDAAEVLRRAKSRGVASAVNCMGWLHGDTKWRLLGSGAVYALPSYFEGLPMALLEAMAVRLPVVATTAGGIPSAITDGVEGFLVPPGDVPALSQALRRLLGDDKLRRTMGDAAYCRVVREFSISVVLPKLESLYRELGGRPS
jgi:glycosyltransferase involved in cell wall biosynthesis